MTPTPRRLPVLGQAPASSSGTALLELLRQAGVGREDPRAGLAAALEQAQRQGREEAIGACLAELSRQGRRVETTRLEAAGFAARLAEALRALDEAGRHPAPELRQALGVCAARLLLEQPGPLSGLEAVELLGRLTALDYALLDVAVSAGVLLLDRPPGARFVVGEAAPGVALEPEAARLPDRVRRAEERSAVLAQHFPGLDAEAVRRASQRLRRLGLFRPEHVYGQPSELGQALLRCSRPLG